MENYEKREKEPRLLPEITQRVIEELYRKHPKLKPIKVVYIDTPRLASYVPPEEDADGYIGLSREWAPIVLTAGMHGPEGQPLREIIADNLGVDPSQLTVDFLVTFIVLHEFGHAYHLFGLEKKEVGEWRERMDKDFLKRWDAHNLADFDARHPHASPEDRLAFARAYRRRPSEERADSLACEMIQSMIRKEPELFPYVTKKVKNYA